MFAQLSCAMVVCRIYRFFNTRYIEKKKTEYMFHKV
jgi:hypothetical protein